MKSIYINNKKIHDIHVTLANSQRLLMRTGAPKSEYYIKVDSEKNIIIINSPIIVALGLFSQGVILLNSPNRLKHGQDNLGKYMYSDTEVTESIYGRVNIYFKKCEC